MAQTIHFVNAEVPPGYEPRKEINPILGDRSSNAKIVAYIGSMCVLHTAVTYVLPNNWMRDAWQYVWIGAEAGAVTHNFVIGLRWQAKFD
jgi:hypothetical protein